MKKDLLIYGGGGLGREVLSMLRQSENWNPLAIIDDRIPKDTVVKGIKVIGGMEVIKNLSGPFNLVLAIGSPTEKQRLASTLARYSGIVFPRLIHPSAILQDEESIQVGAGTIITAGCILTLDIILGDHVLINLNTTIGHNTSIGNYSSIMPGVNFAGGVTIGESVLIGSGANVLNGICIGDHSKVGSGAVVTKNILAGTTAMGVPARIKQAP